MQATMAKGVETPVLGGGRFESSLDPGSPMVFAEPSFGLAGRGIVTKLPGPASPDIHFHYGSNLLDPTAL
jgi:hypothetical protein